MCILLTKWQVLYPLGCLEPCMDLENEKQMNEWKGCRNWNAVDKVQNYISC